MTLMMVVGFSAPSTVQAVSRANLDGLGRNISCGGNNCVAQVLTTKRAPDIIVISVQAFIHEPFINVSDTSGLLIGFRFAGVTTPDGTAWEYLAIAKSRLTSDNITVVFDQPAAERMMQVFAITGFNQTMPIDPYFEGPAGAGNCPPVFCGCANGVCTLSITTSGEDFLVASWTNTQSCVLPSNWHTVMKNTYFQVAYGTVKHATSFTLSCRAASLWVDAFQLD
jgi:hypothetical protein